MAHSLTANLRLELDRTNNTFNRWARQADDWLETNDITYQQHMEECVATIQALQQNEQQLEEAREHNDLIKAQQQSDLARYHKLAETLRQQKQDLERQLHNVEVEEERESQRFEIARSDYDKTQRRLEQSLNDLTQGVKLFLALGLEFHKTDNDCMRFVFTQIDPRSPSRQFYFTMFVDELDKYNLVETQPKFVSSTDIAQTQRLVNNLNTDNSIGKFVVGMRKLFCRTVQSI